MKNGNVEKRLKEIEEKSKAKSYRPVVIIEEGEPVPEGIGPKSIVIIDDICNK